MAVRRPSVLGKHEPIHPGVGKRIRKSSGLYAEKVVLYNAKACVG